MANTLPFDTHSKRYDQWFEQHRATYLSELLAIRAFYPVAGRGLEIGVGTGRFAAPLGIEVGLDPSIAMLRYARRRGIHAIAGTAESLPFRADSFDSVLIVTTICYVDDVTTMLNEIRRILRQNGVIVIAFLNKDSTFGADHIESSKTEFFYQNASFFSSKEVEAHLVKQEFHKFCWGQTLFGNPRTLKTIEPIRSGHGEGLFTVVRANMR